MTKKEYNEEMKRRGIKIEKVDRDVKTILNLRNSTDFYSRV